MDEILFKIWLRGAIILNYFQRARFFFLLFGHNIRFKLTCIVLKKKNQRIILNLYLFYNLYYITYYCSKIFN